VGEVGVKQPNDYNCIREIRATLLLRAQFILWMIRFLILKSMFDFKFMLDFIRKH